MTSTTTKKYFLYSRQQADFRKSLEAKMGNSYTPGYVMVNGARKPYTEISDTPTSKRYADAIVVTQGSLDTIKYNTPTVIRKKR